MKKIYWHRRNVEINDLSISRYIDENYSLITHEILSWIELYPKFDLLGKKLIEFLGIEEKFSYWWMGRLSEKAPTRRKEINELFRYFALILFLENNQSVKEIELYEVDRFDLKTLKKILRDKNIIISISGSVLDEEISKVERLRRKFVRVFAGLFFLKSFFNRLILFFNRPDELFKRQAKLSIATYFPHVDMNKAKEGHFYSKYWGSFNDWINRSKDVDVVFLTVIGSGLTLKEIYQLRNKYQEKSLGNNFLFIEEYLSLIDYLKVFLKYLKLSIKFKKCSVANYEGNNYKGFNLFPAIENLQNDSFFGTSLIDSLIYNEAFKKLAIYNKSHKILYVWENQSWEQALIHQGKKNGHKTFGYQHTVVQPLNLRSFSTLNEYLGKEIEQHPRPDILFTNGQGAKEQLEKYGYPKNEIRIAPAFRFEHLHGKYNCYAPKNHEKKSMLVCLGCYKEENIFLLEILNKYFLKFKSNYNHIIFKPHHFFPIEKELNELSWNVSFEIEKGDLGSCLTRSEIVVSSFTTSANLETIWFGIPTIHIAPKSKLNVNPLFGMEKVYFVGSEDELNEKLKEDLVVPIDKNFISLDQNIDEFVSNFS